MPKSTSTTLPIAFKTSERRILQAAASQSGLPESTWVREIAVAAARVALQQDDTAREDS
jgi:hypothetical protein